MLFSNALRLRLALEAIFYIIYKSYDLHKTHTNVQGRTDYNFSTVKTLALYRIDGWPPQVNAGESA